MKIGVVTVNYIDDAVRNISRFAELLSLVGLPELGENYRKEAEKLNRDRSDQTINEVGDWIRETFKYQGSGSLPDRYVANPDGSADLVLTAEYRDLMHTLGAFVEGKTLSP
ncbi:hypothetical protein J2M53_09895 [Arthrobacter sp. zg-ZUI100]|uniref:hypothetical protein n=1 Tax=Arthrobacter jiangjiafuii TaxID=2817475 RepID=UPI001AEECB92|nr:hypothetical protein [Arthrobacter jiangjiafuii]MBP3036562.1 hypothetical protein [Arthrobacter jiangjiafuii]